MLFMIGVKMELSEYKTLIHQLAESGSNKVFYNQDAQHAEIVLTEIFEKSKETIRIFAAQLNDNPPVSDDYVRKLSDFIERGGKVRILLNKYEQQNVLKSELFKRLAFYVLKEKDIQVKKTSATVYYTNDPDKKELHFTLGDSFIYRIETDVQERMAEGSFNNDVVAKKFIDMFDKLFAEGEYIDLINLFNLSLDAE